jgi:tRNA (guanine37-N1)-methyltransferase
MLKNIIIICGHYNGIDERVRENIITSEISIGDYVLTGGELPAAVLIDSVSRLIPGVISNESAALFDSFQDNLLGHPNYTRPASFNGWKVPEILLSGNQKKIDEWRIENSYKKTKKLRPDLL